jgi:hypothetical protein
VAVLGPQLGKAHRAALSDVLALDRRFPVGPGAVKMSTHTRRPSGGADSADRHLGMAPSRHPGAFWAVVQESPTQRSGTDQLHMPTGRGDKHFEVVTVECDDLVAVHGYEGQRPVDHVRCPGLG